MTKKVKLNFNHFLFKQKRIKRENIHQLLFKHNLFNAFIFFIITILLFNYIYNILAEEQKSSKENLVIHNITTEIEDCRFLLEEYRVSKIPQRKKELLLQQEAILINIENEINSLKILYQDSPTRYFLNNGILNGKKTINELISKLQNENIQNDSDFYKIYYRISNTYDYLYTYLTNQYLLAMVKDNVAQMQARAEQITNLRVFSILVFVLLLIGYLISTSIISKKMLTPIDAMVETAKEIADGNLETDSPIIEGPKELVFLEESIKNMKDSLKDRLSLINENTTLEKEIHKKEIEQLKIQKELERAKYNSLQSQINPHFPFNTLNVIQLTALFENAEQTGKLIESLGAILRYSLEHQETITIGEEIFFIKQYLKIQQARFNDRLKYTVKCGELCKNIIIPPLILQPLVENAIIHGIEPKEEGGKVSIDAFKDKDNIIINISDTGVGMENYNQIALINNKNEKGHNIGISNIVERLNIYFNGKASINFSALNSEGGCKVQIIIPFEV